ncbi:zinc finger protein 276 [Chanos chanos]|uniref:Zinc finger protein 276 n=1 Tax=Chanos chanos TaxID=29144 RepID=A0A6J2WB96_CHACN|nr:zinc finger protein 276 [Chanos chanos]
MKRSARSPRAESTVHARPGPAVRRPGRRGRPRHGTKKIAAVEMCESSFSEKTSGGTPDTLQPDVTRDVEKLGEDRPASTSKQTGSGRLNTEFCRLCHGKFSTRRLRQAFDNLQGESVELYNHAEKRQSESSLLFCLDFQQLLGVPMHRDPRLSQFICKNCHAQFYKCHSILLAFRQRVNLTPSARDTNRDRVTSEWSQSKEDVVLTTPISSDPKCLHNLVSWAHHHAEGCRACPDLKEVLEGQYWGSVRAVWGCVDGHSYVMDTNATQPRVNPGHAVSGAQSTGGERSRGETNHEHQAAARLNNSSTSSTSTPTAHPSQAATPQTQNSAQSDLSTVGADGLPRSEEIPSPVPAHPVDRPEDSDLSDRNFSSEDEYEDKRKSASSDDQADPYPEKRTSPKKSARAGKNPTEPKVKRKPGPQPGWKKKIKSEREELPNIYKCPHQGCTAVYRGADGMKKHIKEHHEEVRERPCPHPGCNKVFMIDRYLQRHVKLIHTEVRNYICDQCGQTFKQRKHLSVHQMRHSGAKPLQCEVCGFQCRQRASLKYHMTKHKAEADLEFACALCGKRFEKAHNLNVHMSMVHPLTQGGSIDSGPIPVPPDLDQQNPSASRPLNQQAPAHRSDHASEPPRTVPNTSDMDYMLASLQ